MCACIREIISAIIEGLGAKSRNCVNVNGLDRIPAVEGPILNIAVFVDMSRDKGSAGLANTLDLRFDRIGSPQQFAP